MNNINRIQYTREAGAVERAHTIPHHGEYSVAKHCYNAVSMLMILNPKASLTLVQAMLWHDGAERWMGDTPAPAKWAFQDFGREYKAAENTVLKEKGMGDAVSRLTEDETKWLKCIDMLELWVWCHDQQAMGNRNVQPTLRMIDDTVKKNFKTMPKPCQLFYQGYQWKRSSDNPNSIEKGSKNGKP